MVGRLRSGDPRDGAFAKDGGDPGVFAVSRYLPWSDTTVVLLSNVDEKTVEDLETIADTFIDTAEAAP